MFGDKVPYNDRAGLEKRAKGTVEKISASFSKIYQQVKALVQSTTPPGSPMNFDREGRPVFAPTYIDEKYKDLGGYIGNVKDPDTYKRNWPQYVIGMYHLALIKSGVVHEMLPDVATRALTPDHTEYAFSDGTTVILERDSRKGLYTWDRAFNRVQLDPLAEAIIYVPTRNRGPVRLGDL
jgi:hypothetical protein